MKILVYGAGVIGSIFASRLYSNVNDVCILARGNRLEEIIERTSTIISVKPERSLFQSSNSMGNNYPGLVRRQPSFAPASFGLTRRRPASRAGIDRPVRACRMKYPGLIQITSLGLSALISPAITDLAFGT